MVDRFLDPKLIGEKIGLQSKLKESHRKLRRKHQRRNEKYCFAEFSDVFQVDDDGLLVDQDAKLELGEIIKWLNLQSFLGVNYEIWENEMKTILWKVNSLDYVEYVINDSGDASALRLITFALDDNIILNIIYEYGEVIIAKFLCDVLEMKYYLNEGNDVEDIALENDPIFDYETKYAMMGDECVSVTETCDDENTSIIVEPEFFLDAEIMFDETYIPHDEWINLMIKKHLIDELLFGEKEGLSSHTDQMQNIPIAT